jgi:hypothetical protein
VSPQDSRTWTCCRSKVATLKQYPRILILAVACHRARAYARRALRGIGLVIRLRATAGELVAAVIGESGYGLSVHTRARVPANHDYDFAA